MPDLIRVRRSVLQLLADLASISPDVECCGLLAGTDGAITHVFRAQNAAESPTAYEIAPEDLFRLLRDIRAADLKMLGIYHSHPRGENAPSPSDIEQANYPEAAHFILSPQPDAPKRIRAFAIREGLSLELEIVAIEG